MKRTKINEKNNTLSLWWGLKKIRFGRLGGKNVRLNNDCFWGNAENIYIDDNVFIARALYIDAICEVHIKEGTMIGPRCTMIAGNHNYRSKDVESVPYDNKIIDTPIIIERNVWIGADVMICPGTHIGEGAVIGAGTSVHGKIPSFSIVVPSDYRIVGRRDEDQYHKLNEKGAIYNRLYAEIPFKIVKGDGTK